MSSLKLSWRESAKDIFVSPSKHPPALSPSTMNNSDSLASRLEQSASFPGKVKPSMTPLRRIVSRAILAALRALAASTHLPMIASASLGCSSRKIRKLSPMIASTAVRASVLPSLDLVWPSNCGSLILIEIMVFKPSRASSPVRLGSFSRKIFLLRA